MKLKIICTLIISLVITITSTNTSHAGGFFASNVFVQAVPTESKALIVFDGKKETLFDSVTFNINPVIAWNFTWIMAVPGKPEVSLVLDDLYTKLEKFSDKKINKDNLWNKLLYFDVSEEKTLSKSLYTRGLDFTKTEVFGPEKSQEDLNSYLQESGYYIPKEGITILDEYRKKNWYIVVAEINANHLQMDSSESLTVPGAHTYPIKIEFETDKIVYPLRLARVQPDYDSENVALNYEYGSKSETVLGAKDERIDDMLSYQSKNKYPRLPFDYGYQQVELFVISDQKVESNEFTTSYAGWITKTDIDFTDFPKKKYFELPENKMFFTRIFTFKPLIQLDDVLIDNATNNQLVNSKPPTIIQVLKLLAIPSVVVIFLIWKLKRKD